MDVKNFVPDGESECRPAAKELPEYLKQKLRARGILKDEPEKSNQVSYELLSIYLLFF